jgi:hypothetical protein
MLETPGFALSPYSRLAVINAAFEVGNTMSITLEADILSRVIAPDNQALSPEAARTILEWKFPPIDVETMTRLSQKANAGTLTAAEQEALDSYERVGHLIAMAQSKARLSLKQTDSQD